MVKIYKNGMPVEYTYSDAGKYTLKIAGNLKTASFSGSSDLNNGLATTLVSVETFDKNLKELESNAFNSCKKLQYINLAKSRIVKAGDNAFRNCCALLDMTYNTDLTSFGSNCFSNDGTVGTSIMQFIAPDGYEKDVAENGSYEESKLKEIGSSAFAGNAIKCIVVPAGT